MVYALAQGADYIWLLNNDTTVHHAALNSLVDIAKSDQRIGAVGAAIYSAHNPHRLEAWGGGYVSFWLGRSRHFLKRVSDNEIQFITGASLLLSGNIVRKQGFFDEGFFMYWEDADYCFRLRRAGWKLAVAGESKIWHKGSASVGHRSARMDTYFNASAARFFRKHTWAPAVPLWTGVGLRLAKRAIAGDWDKVRAVWAGASGPWVEGR
jgi:GT2 family glycosyltransferase